MKFETERILCVIADDVAHVQFKNATVTEYTEAARLGPELRHIADAFAFRVMVVDFAALDAATSTLLEALVGVHLRCRRKGRSVRVVNANTLVRDLLVTTHLDRIIPVFDRIEDAIRLDIPVKPS